MFLHSGSRSNPWLGACRCSVVPGLEASVSTWIRQLMSGLHLQSLLAICIQLLPSFFLFFNLPTTCLKKWLISYLVSVHSKRITNFQWTCWEKDGSFVSSVLAARDSALCWFITQVMCKTQHQHGLYWERVIYLSCTSGEIKIHGRRDTMLQKPLLYLQIFI